MTTAADGEAGAAAAPELRIVSRGATSEDIAAVTAVLSMALAELASGMDAEAHTGMSGWRRSQRPIRSTLPPASGQWRSFSG